MKGIRGLLIKDLCLMGEIRKLLLIILFVTAIFIFNGTSSTFLTGYIMIIIAFLVGMTISYDEMNNGLAFLMTLPVTRRQYVAEKFICGLLSWKLCAGSERKYYDCSSLCRDWSDCAFFLHRYRSEVWSGERKSYVAFRVYGHLLFILHGCCISRKELSRKKGSFPSVV